MDRCGYCGSVVVIQTDHARINVASLNKSVINEHIAQYRKALRIDRRDATAHYGLGVAYFNLGLLEEASDELAQAVKLMPENANIQTQLAVVLAMRAPEAGPSYLKQSWDRLNRALTLDPQNTDALMLKAHHFQRQIPAATSKNESVIIQQQLVDTWKEIEQIDPERIRSDVTTYLRTNAHLIPEAEKEKARKSKPQTNRKKETTSFRKPWFWKTLGLSILALVILIVISFILSVPMGTTESGDDDTSGFLGVLFVISVISWFVAPIVVFIRGFRKSKRRMVTYVVPDEEGSDPMKNEVDGLMTIQQLAYAPGVSVDRLVNASEFLVQVQRKSVIDPSPIVSQSVGKTIR
jgi:TPR repeat